MKISGVVIASLVATSVLVAGIGTPGPTAAAAAPTSVDCDVAPAGPATPAPAPELESFEPQVPERIVDTRVDEGGDGPVGEGCTLVVDMTGIGPDDLTAYALSVTAITPATGYVTAFPCADGLPGTSSVNPRVGVATPNLVVVSPDEDGRVCLFVLAGGELIVDVSGWWSAGPNRFRPIEPVRVDDTREALPIKLPAGDVRAIDVAGVAVPDDAVAVTMNVAAVETEGEGFLVVFPCGIPVPLASNVNYLANETRSVAAIVKLGDSADESARGKLCVSASQDLHVVVDVTGYLSDTAGALPDLVLEPVSDSRVVDTRIADLPGERFTRQTVQRFDLSDVIDRPDDAVGVLLNVVAVAPDEDAFVTVYPCTEEVPFVASINHDDADTANLVVSALDDDGAFCVFANRGVDLVVDLVGVYTGPEGSLLNELTLRDSATGDVVPLDQPFTVDGADYTIPCDADRTFDLRIGRAPGVSVTINRAEVQPPLDASDPDREVTIPDEGLLVVEVERGSRSDTYHVRCLPTDFPRFLAEGADAVTPGWYLSDVGWNDPGSGKFAAIFDERGVPVWYKRNTEILIDVKRLSTGDLAMTPITGTGFGVDSDRGYLVVDLDGNVVDTRETGIEQSPSDHHDYIEIPSASGTRRAVVSYPIVEGVDLTGLDLPATTGQGTCDPSVADMGKTIVDGQIVEQESGWPTWTWSMSDHDFDAAEAPYAQCFLNFPDRNDGAGEVDPFHINSIARVRDPGCEPTCDYVVSARHLDSVFRVDRQSEDVSWILGPAAVNPSADHLTLVGDPRNGPLRMHDARMVGDVLTMHDNRTGSGQPSRAVAYRIDPDEDTATMLWQIEHPDGQNNPSLGSVQLTADGSVAAAWGRATPVFSEHRIDGTELLRWTLVDASMTPYRIVKYPIGAFDVDELRDTAGGSITGITLKPGAVPMVDPLPV